MPRSGRSRQGAEAGGQWPQQSHGRNGEERWAREGGEGVAVAAAGGGAGVGRGEQGARPHAGRGHSTRPRLRQLEQQQLRAGRRGPSGRAGAAIAADARWPMSRGLARARCSCRTSATRRSSAVAAAGRGQAWRAGDGRLGAAMCGQQQRRRGDGRARARPRACVLVHGTNQRAR
nr:circumsporozoite protein-like [Aegilops tauschii subsp. strangulata]